MLTAVFSASATGNLWSGARLRIPVPEQHPLTGFCFRKPKFEASRTQVFALGPYFTRTEMSKSSPKAEEDDESDEEETETAERFEEADEDDVEDEEEEENDEIGRLYKEEEGRQSGSIDFSAAHQLLEAVAVLKDAQAIRVQRMVKGWMNSRDDVINKYEFLYVMRRLRKRNRAKHALKIADWMFLTRPRPFPLITRDFIFRIDLACRCGAVNKAERIFQRLSREERSEVAYTALLLGYTKSRKLNSAEKLFRELVESGLISSAYSINLMASLYRQIGMDSKVLWLQAKAQELGVQLDICFYNNLLAAKFKVEGLEEAEKVYSYIMSSTNKKRFFTCLAMASCYVSAGKNKKAEEMLERIEQGMETGEIVKQRRRYNVLISMFAIVGSVAGMERTWDRLIQLRTPVSEDYCCMIKSWGKVGQPALARKLFTEAEARETSLKYSAIFNAMMFVYSRLEMREEAEALVVRMEYELGIQLDPWCYHHLILLYAKQQDLDKMLSTLKIVQVLGKKERHFKPLPASLWVALNSLAEVGDVETAEEILRKWKRADYRVNTSLYNRVLKAYLVAGKPVVRFVERMLADGVRPNTETEQFYDQLKLKKLVN